MSKAIPSTIRPVISSSISLVLSSLLLSKKLNSSGGNKTIEIEIKKFKKINSVKLKLEPVNIFIGTNNSGKSSFIQGIQFAISSCQTLQLKKVNWVKKTDARTLSLDSSDFLYTPTRHIEHLYHGHKLTGAKTKNDRKFIFFKFKTSRGESSIAISRGKNGGFTTTQIGKLLGDDLNSIDHPFCVYVPGIAGIPIVEKFEVPISIKKSATRGDSNNFLRNILLSIHKNSKKWQSFHLSLNRIYSNTTVNVFFDENVSEFIDVYVSINNIELPIDSVGTGVLQTIQIFAYIEYFNPKILLLDEPDSHIHPTKQKLLANELFERAAKDQNLRIVFSTHSRYILEALEGKAQVVHFQNGNAYSGIKDSKILLDIGAADADYLFSKKNLKYIIVTEDKVDNIAEKKQYLKTFINANGLSDEEFVLHSYEGCSKVYFAKLLEGFVRKHIPHAKVIVHIDRDQKVDGDRDLQKLITDCIDKDLLLFITEYSEIENYFCQPKHLENIYGIDQADAKKLYTDKVKELETTTKEKISNFLLRERKDLCLNSSGMLDIKTINELAKAQYSAAGEFLTPGKELIGKIKDYIQTTLKKKPLEINKPSPGLSSTAFTDLLK